MHTLHKWSAQRAGAAITVKGKDVLDQDVKVVGVKVLEPKNGMIIAVGKDGNAWGLAV